VFVVTELLFIKQGELAESRQIEVAVDTFGEDLSCPIRHGSSEMDELHPVVSCGQDGHRVSDGRMQEMQCTDEEELEDENKVNSSVQLRVRKSFANAEFGYFTRTVVKELPDSPIDNEGLEDDFIEDLPQDSGRRSSVTSLSKVAEDADFQAIASHSENSIVVALDSRVQLESCDEVGVEHQKLDINMTFVDEVDMDGSIVVQSDSEGASMQSLPDHDSNRDTPSELKQTMSASPEQDVSILNASSKHVDSQLCEVTQKASSKVDNILNNIDIEDEKDGEEQEKSLQFQSEVLSDFDLSYRSSVGHKSSLWAGSASVSHVNVINNTDDRCGKTAAAAVSLGQVATRIDETVDSVKSVNGVSSVSGTVVIDKKLSLLTSMESSTIQLSTESHVDMSNTVSKSSVSDSQQDDSEQVFQAAISDESIESYLKVRLVRILLSLTSVERNDRHSTLYQYSYSIMTVTVLEINTVSQ